MKTKFYIPITILSLSTILSSCAFASLQEAAEEKAAAKPVVAYVAQASALTKMTPQDFAASTADKYAQRLTQTYKDLTDKKDSQITAQQDELLNQARLAVRVLAAYKLSTDDITTLRAGNSLVLNNTLPEFNDAVVTITPGSLETLQQIMPYTPDDLKGHRIRLALLQSQLAENASVDATGNFVVRPSASHKMASKASGKMLRYVLPENMHATEKSIPIAIKVTFPSVQTRIESLNQSFGTFKASLQESNARLSQILQTQTASEHGTKDFADWAYGKKCEKLLSRMADVEDTESLFASPHFESDMAAGNIDVDRVKKAAEMAILKQELKAKSSRFSFEPISIFEAAQQDQKITGFERMKKDRKEFRQALKQLGTL